MNSRKNDILFNVQFWLLYFAYEWLANAAVACEYRRYLINAIVIVPVTFAGAMFTVHVLFKHYYLKNRKRLFWAGLIVSMVAFVFLRRAFNYYYTYPLYYPEGNTTMSYVFLPKLIIEGVSMYLIVGLYSMFYFIKAWYEQQRLAQEFKQAKVEAELAVLKSQVHPHFIFNTLNNIYSLTLQRHDKAPNLIHHLSSFLSYNLYDGTSRTIPLTKELEHINNYIELEKIRYGNRLDVSVNVFDPIDNFNISPLLLLPLIENCFKHGVTPATGNCWIQVDISLQKDWLTVKFENSLSGEHRQNGHRNGIGLENVKRRLEIIYPEAHELRCIREQQSYLSILKIKNLTHDN
ncbi:histidine kinase [Fulvivirgaceae bacterium PWU4]|uniref:Histidine kinase n=1 Tax=Chryseosolibacter histidini TaxID=2782349 RepID=A0AAP2DM40_9BACT|nr:histidine kinase [Chryseosolibacter histidini]MBT1697652.1 histidine kinase [Chryseosolibacter histidini]